MVDLSSLRQRVASVHHDVRQVSEWVLQFTRRMDNVPFAVCYLDVGPSLPETQQALTEYQDRIIGAHYFRVRRVFSGTITCTSSFHRRNSKDAKREELGN
jgi:hypothetical protein